MPPRDRSHLLETWARQKGYWVVEPPARRAVFGNGAQFPPETGASQPLIIPRLERWFLRHHQGLHAIWSLLAKLDALKQPCIIGCNSWAWAYLATATGAGVILPKGQTSQAFDAERLHSWFSKLAESGETAAMTFRLASNGQDVLASKAKGEHAHRYLKQLASRSLGIPWVAWTMWRESLRSHGDLKNLSDEAQQAVDADARTLWVTEPKTLYLPTGHEGSSLLVLQSLLIHDELDAADLAATLPSGGDPDVVSALVATGFVERNDDGIRVRTGAYPTIRELLEAAGYPLDLL